MQPRTEFGPIDKGLPMGSKVKMSPCQFPSFLARRVFLPSARLPQCKVARQRFNPVAGCLVVALAMQSQDQQPVGGPSGSSYQIAIFFMKVAGNNVEAKRISLIRHCSVSRITHALAKFDMDFMAG